MLCLPNWQHLFCLHMNRTCTTLISLNEVEQLERAGKLGYRQPDNKILVDIANTKVNSPHISLSPDRSWLLQCDSPKFTPMAHCKCNAQKQMVY